jgi:hypothetical protein
VLIPYSHFWNSEVRKNFCVTETSVLHEYHDCRPKEHTPGTRRDGYRLELLSCKNKGEFS